MNESTNITYVLKEVNDEKENIFDLEDLIKHFEEIEYKTTSNKSDEEFLNKVASYDINYTVKQLYLMCDYYQLKIQKGKLKKQEIIEKILCFEYNKSNIEMVNKRKLFWYYLSELKNDNFMKKFVIWD
jgi:hypothetical protein